MSDFTPSARPTLPAQPDRHALFPPIQRVRAQPFDPQVVHWFEERPRQDATLVAGLFVSSAGTVYPATIAGVMPTIGGVALDSGTNPAVTIPGTGTQYVVATITGTHSISATNFATNLTSRAVAISVSTTAITTADTNNVASGGAFRILLATFVNGNKTAQNGYGPITCNFYDDGSNSGKLNMEVLYPRVG